MEVIGEHITDPEQLSDIDTASYLQEFKEKYFAPIENKHNYYQKFKDLPEGEKTKAETIKNQYYFLSSFIASIEATLEQNMYLKLK